MREVHLTKIYQAKVLAMGIALDVTSSKRKMLVKMLVLDLLY